MAFVLALYASIVGLSTVLGWVLKVEWLADWDRDGIAMFANTGIAAFCAGAGILCLTSGHRRPAMLLGAAAGLIGFATLLEHILGLNFGIDTLLFSPTWGIRGATAPGRMGPPAALSLSCAGAGILLLARSAAPTRAVPVLGLIIAAVATLSITGYAYGADRLFASPRWTGIAFQTSTILLALGLSLVALTPGRQPMRTLLEQSAAGLLARRAIVFIVVLPIALGWLRVRAQEAGLFGTAIGTALLVLSLIFMLIMFLWWAAAAVRGHEEALRVRDEVFRTMFDVSSVGMAKADPADGRLLRANQTFADILGYPISEVLGRSFMDFTHPDDREPNAETFRRLISGEPSTYHVEKRFIRADGSIVWADVTANLVKDRDGTPLRTVAIIKDITQRKRDEQALTARAREQEVLYRFTDRLHRASTLQAIFDAALDAITGALSCRRASILLFDDRGVMRFVAWRGLSDHYRSSVDGHSPWKLGEQDAQPLAIFDITAAPDVPESLRSVVTGEGIRALAFIPLIAGGRLIGKFMAYHEVPHRFSPAELELATTIARQLAFGVERARSVQALRESEERLRIATNAGKIGLWEWDIPANRVVWTESLYAIHGVTHEQFGATIESFADLVHPDDLAAVREATQRSLENGDPYELEFRAIRPDGQVIWIFTNAVVVREHGRPVRMTGASLDITDRKAAQHALADSELLFRTLGEAVPDFLWMADERGNHLYQNPAWRQYTGLSSEAFAAGGWDSVIHPDELPLMRRLWSHSLATGEPFDFEGRLRRHDGVFRWFMGRTVPVKNEQGRVTRWVGTLTDMEDRKRLERDRDEHAADLSLALAGRTEQVTRAQQRLAANDRLAAVGTLAAGLGHDLSNLLLPLTVRLEGLLARHDLPEDVRSDIEAADALIGHLRALARNLRMFVRDPGQTGPEQATDLHEWVQRVQRFLGVIAGGVGGADTRVEYEIPPGVPPVAIAPHQLTQAVTNLVHNAREAIAARRASQPASLGEGHIRITASACPQAAEVVLMIKDDGVGMTDEVRRRCMEPFFTTKDRATDGAHVGTGIGLATVHAAIAQAGGRIEIESTPGEGTTFTLHLPVTASVRVPHAPHHAPQRAAGQAEPRSVRVEPKALPSRDPVRDV